jgi:hypothetical protein
MHDRSDGKPPNEQTNQTMGPSLQNARRLPTLSQAKSLIPQPPLRARVTGRVRFRDVSVR